MSAKEISDAQKWVNSPESKKNPEKRAQVIATLAKIKR
jgi:hypothetical protein